MEGLAGSKKGIMGQEGSPLFSCGHASEVPMTSMPMKAKKILKNHVFS